MAVTGINSEDRLVQATFAEHLKDVLGWESVYAWNDETFGPGGTLGRAGTSEAVLTRDLRAALATPEPRRCRRPPSTTPCAQLTVHDFSRSMVQHNQRLPRSDPQRRAGLMARCQRPAPRRPRPRDRLRQRARQRTASSPCAN